MTVAWVPAVACGGGLTLWLRAGGEPREPYGWQRTPDDTPPTPPADSHECPRQASTLCAFTSVRR